MAFELPALPYADDALAPTISAETISYHYGKHHNAYVTNLNKLTEGTPQANDSLESIIANSSGGLFNNAAQVWNHSFYWQCMTPKGSKAPGGDLGKAISSSFGSLDELKTKFIASATGNFASGWTWLVKGADGGLEILNTDDADTPLAHGKVPVLTVDVWEHAYYVDYRNGRGPYLEAWWDIINWDFVAERFAAK